MLLQYLERLKETYKNNNYLVINVNLAWVKLKEYYRLMNIIPIYTVTVFLHPKFRFEYFKKRWNTKVLRPYQRPTLVAIRKLYDEQYRSNVTETTLQVIDVQDEEQDIFDAFLNENITPKDEFDIYIDSATTALDDNANLFKW